MKDTGTEKQTFSPLNHKKLESYFTNPSYCVKAYFCCFSYFLTGMGNRFQFQGNIKQIRIAGNNNLMRKGEKSMKEHFYFVLGLFFFAIVFIIAFPGNADEPSILKNGTTVPTHAYVPGVFENDDASSSPASAHSCRPTTDSRTLIFTDLVAGDPYAENSIFFLDVRVRGNQQSPLQSYSFSIYYNSGLVELVSPPQSLEIDAAVFSGPPRGPGPYVQAPVISHPNPKNSLLNPGLCRLQFRTRGASSAQYSIKIGPNPPNVSLVDQENRPIAADYDNSKTDPLPRHVEVSATPADQLP